MCSPASIVSRLFLGYLCPQDLIIFLGTTEPISRSRLAIRLLRLLFFFFWFNYPDAAPFVLVTPFSSLYASFFLPFRRPSCRLLISSSYLFFPACARPGVFLPTLLLTSCSLFASAAPFLYFSFVAGRRRPFLRLFSSSSFLCRRLLSSTACYYSYS